MGSHTAGGGATRPLTRYEQTKLRDMVTPVKRDVASANSPAKRHRLRAQARHLREYVDEIGASSMLSRLARAVETAIEAGAADRAASALVKIELAAKGLPITAPRQAPAPIELAPAADAAAAPIGADDEPGPIAAAAVPAADDAPLRPDQVASVEQLGEAVRGARSRKGLTQHQAAVAAGVGRRFVVDLEGGKATSEVGRVLAVCRAVGLALVASPA